MIKNANVRAIWPIIYKNLKNPPQGIDLGTFPSQLPPMNKILFENVPPSDNPSALGYVTTEDADGDGTLDSMHLVIPNLERHLQGISPADLQDGNLDKLYRVLRPFVEIIAHEMGHQKDYVSESENPFPGGEGVADQAARQALNNMSIKATNNNVRGDNFRRKAMKAKIVETLVKLADSLDVKGEVELSDQVFAAAEKFAQELSFPQRQHSIQSAQLYHPDGLRGVKEDGFVALKDVDFSWGSYNGSLKNEKYFIMQGRRELGSVQFNGDPYTYEQSSPGKLIVVSGPESTRHAIGRIIKDPRKGTQHPHAKKLEKLPSQQGDVSLLASELGFHGGVPSLRTVEARVASVMSRTKKLESDIIRRLEGMGFEGRSVSSRFKSGVNYAQRVVTVERSLPMLERAGYDVRILSGAAKALKSNASELGKLLRLKNALSLESKASDGLVLKTASSKEGSLEVENVKNVFMLPSTKSPFGR